MSAPSNQDDPLVTDPPPSYAEAVESLRRAKSSARRPSAASAWTVVDLTVASTSERQPLLASGTAEHLTSERSSLNHGYFAPLSQKRYWKSLFHLLVLNFPFALAAWLSLFVGVLVGTSLLLTLPLGKHEFPPPWTAMSDDTLYVGALVWWITLILSRSFTNFEVRGLFDKL